MTTNWQMRLKVNASQDAIEGYGMKPMTELENEYLERRLRSCVAASTRNLEGATTGNKERLTRGLAYWTEALTCYKADLAHEGGDRIRKKYVRTLSRAVRDGQPVSRAVEESDAYRKAVENRRRYEKGRHTSFANQSAAVDDSMKPTRGYKTKRQDGKPMTPAQLAEIEDIVTVFESMVRPMADLFAKTDLTIAHTNGKHPFMRSSGGIYHSKERTISVGVIVAEMPIRAGAHELTHWLDAEAGAAIGASKRLRNTSGRRAYDSTYLSEFVGHLDNDPENELLADAWRTVNCVDEAHQLFSRRTERTDERDRVRASLGPYWHRRCEIYARLLEQWVGTKLGSVSSAAESPEVYQSMPGWWTEGAFLELMPAVERSVERRIELLRGLSDGSQGQE